MMCQLPQMHHSVSDVDNGWEAVRVWVWEQQGKSLNLPLNFIRNLKLL